MKFSSNIYILLLLFIHTSLFSQSPSFNKDTINFTNKKGDKIEAKIINETFSSKDNKQIAVLFYETGYYIANSITASIPEYNKAYNLFNYAIEFYTKSNLISEAALCLEHQATIQYELTYYEKSVTLFQKAIVEYEKIKPIDYNRITIAYSNIGYIYLNTHRFENAIRFFKKAHQTSLNLNKPELTSKYLYQIGLAFFESNEYDSSLVYYKKAYSFDKTLNKPDEIVASLNNISVVYLYLENYESAFDYLMQTKPLIEESKNKKNQAIFYNNYGNILTKQGKYSEAIKNYELSLSLKKELEDKEGMAITYKNIAHAYLLDKKYDKGLEAIIKGLDLSKSKYADKTYGLLCKTAADLYEKKNDFKNAHQHYDLFIKNAYSILAEAPSQISETQEKYSNNDIKASNIEREIKMQQLFAAYDFNIKKNQISTLEQERKQQRTTLYILAGIIVFIIFGALVLYNRYNMKKKASTKLELQNEEIERKTQIIQNQSEELKEQNTELEKLTIVASNTDNAILIMDEQGNFEWVNAAFTRMFGFTFDELCARISNNMIGPNTPEYIVTSFNTCKNQKITVNYDLQTKNKFGDEMWVNVTLTPILDDSGELSKLVMIDSDITSLKLAEQEIINQKNHISNQKIELENQRDYVISQSKELEEKRIELTNTLDELQSTQKKLVESEKMAALGGLVAGISHEINTPVGIGTAASTTLFTKTTELFEMFESKKMKQTDLQSFIETVQNACDLLLKNLKRTAELVKSFNQVSVDNMSEQKREFNLKEYLKDVSISLAPKLKGRPVKLEMNCPDDIILNSYPGAFAQIFTNFIINSLVHGFDETQEGILVIKVTELEKEFILEYKDNGKGIPKENLPKVFEAFFTTNKEVGTGLGMSITHNLITQKLGGEVSLQSDVNAGVHFTITVPKESVL